MALSIGELDYRRAPQAASEPLHHPLQSTVVDQVEGPVWYHPLETTLVDYRRAPQAASAPLHHPLQSTVVDQVEGAVWSQSTVVDQVEEAAWCVVVGLALGWLDAVLQGDCRGMHHKPQLQLGVTPAQAAEVNPLL